MEYAKAAVITAVNAPLEIREYPLVDPEKGTALLKMLASGVCGTDLHIWHGKIGIATPVIPGHEFIGEVLALHPDDAQNGDWKLGDRVLVNVAAPCGACPLCRAGDEANCVNMGVRYTVSPDVAPHLHGGYATHLYAPFESLVRLPDALDPQMTDVFACAGATAIHAMKLCAQAGMPPENVGTAVVQGLGPVGLFTVMYLSKMGARVVALTTGKNPARDRMAKAFGAHSVLSIAQGMDSVTARVLELSGGLGADMVVEASGNPDAFAQGLALLRNRGVYAVPGQYSNGRDVAIPPQVITFKALRIIGSSQYDARDIQSYFDFLLEHPELHGDIAKLYTCYPVEKVNEAIADAQAGLNIKTLLR